MNSIVICPADRPEVAFLARSQPLALVPILGRPLLDLWLTDLAAHGTKHVRVLAADRPDQVRRFVGKGEAWGIQAEVIPEQRELSPEEARSRHAGGLAGKPSDIRVVALDQLPPSGTPLWSGTSAWVEAIRSHLELAASDRVGMRQPSPGIFIHVRARLSPDATLRPPCWIGANSWIGPRAVIGPNSIVEAHSYVDDGASVVGSLVGPNTYVGTLTEISDSIAWGRGLCKVATGSCTEVTDSFLLGPVSARLRRSHATVLLGRLVALLLLLTTWPVLALAWLRKAPGTPLFGANRAVQAPTSAPETAGTIAYRHLNGFQGLLRRWPELINIVRGEFRWVGNRPLTPEQARSLTTEFERLWLGVAPGLISLADAEKCPEPFGDEARAHASFYAVRPTWRHRLNILKRAILG